MHIPLTLDLAVRKEMSIPIEDEQVDGDLLMAEDDLDFDLLSRGDEEEVDTVHQSSATVDFATLSTTFGHDEIAYHMPGVELDNTSAFDLEITGEEDGQSCLSQQ